MNKEEIISVLRTFFDEIKEKDKKLDVRADCVYMDFLEMYHDFLLKEKKKPSGNNIVALDNLLELMKTGTKLSKENNIDELITALVYIDVVLDHTYNHIKEARKGLKVIINRLNKQLPDDED